MTAVYEKKLKERLAMNAGAEQTLFGNDTAASSRNEKCGKICIKQKAVQPQTELYRIIHSNCP